MTGVCGADVEGGYRCIRLVHADAAHAWRATNGFVTVAPVPEDPAVMLAVIEEVRALVRERQQRRRRVGGVVREVVAQPSAGPRRG